MIARRQRRSKSEGRDRRRAQGKKKAHVLNMKQSIALATLPCALAQHTEGSILEEPWSIVSLTFLFMLLMILMGRG